jgi:hypothetical protein
VASPHNDPDLLAALDELRREAAAKGAELGSASRAQLRTLLAAADGDVDLAAEAAALEPRPGWVAVILGAHP